MKALILKDFYVLWKQMRLFLAVLLLLCVVNSTFNSVFLMVWCSMLPYTAMAYDERSHWDQLAAMMPFSKRDIVLSKYALGWLCMGAVGAISLAMQFVTGLIPGRTTDTATLFVSLCGGVVCLALVMPLVLRFGVERGRMVFMLAVMGTAVLAGIFVEMVDGTGGLPLPGLAALPAAALISTAVSIPLSMKLYRPA